MATTIANTIVAIEQEQLPADRVNEPIPRPPEEEQAPETPSEEEPAEEPVAEPPPEAADEVPTPPPAPRLQLGVTVAGGPVLGLAPSEAQALAAGGGELRGTLRWPSGAMVTAGLRITGRRGRDAGLLRTRVALGGGYTLRRERLEVVLGAAATAEPWWVASEAFEDDDATRARRSPLLGGVGWTSVGYLAGRSGGLQTRIGAFAELGGSVVPPGTAARVIRGDPPATEVVFTLGGAELSAGLDVTVWISLPRR